MTDEYISEMKIYTEVVKENIDFDYFAEWLGDEEEAEEIVQMMVRQICSSSGDNWFRLTAFNSKENTVEAMERFRSLLKK